MSVRSYIRDGTSLTLSVDGHSASVRAVVPANLLTGDDLGRLMTALQQSGVPQFLSPSEGVPGMVVRSVTAAPFGPSVVIDATYGPPSAATNEPSEADEGVIEVGSTLVTTTTMRDAAGDPIVLAYTYSDGPYKGQKIQQYGEVEEEVPHATVRVTRREPNSPLAKSLAYTGAANATPWQGFAALTMMVTEIRGVSVDGGNTYDVTYELVYRAEGWSKTVVYRDHLQSNGAAPADVFDQQSAFKDLPPRRTAHFFGLNLPAVTL